MNHLVIYIFLVIFMIAWGVFITYCFENSSRRAKFWANIANFFLMELPILFVAVWHLSEFLDGR